MKKIFFLLTVALLLTNAISAQENGPVLTWETNNIDFGDINEEDGNVTKRFEFTNTGSLPLVITNVKPSCGCTSSNYTKEPVAPGAKGFVDATYNPLQRPGKFSKSITVMTNATPPSSIIKFYGNVIPKPKTLADVYPQKIGSLSSETKHIALMKVANNTTKTESIGVANTTESDINITFKNVPSHITVQATPKTLKPQEEGKIIVTYDASKKDDWGFIIDKITVQTNNDAESEDNKLSVSATIYEDFTTLTDKEKANAPKITFDDLVFNFGTINEGDKANHSFSFVNEGKSDLIIRKIKPSCGCTIVKPSSEIIKPGEKGTLDIAFNSAGKKNKQNKSITIITNDPANSQVVLRITGTVNVN